MSNAALDLQFFVKLKDFAILRIADVLYAFSWLHNSSYFDIIGQTWQTTADFNFRPAYINPDYKKE